MHSSGLNYFYNSIGFPTDSWKIFYDFSGSGVFMPSISGGQNGFSGVCSTETTGYFTGQNIKISNAQDLNASYWNIFTVFEKLPNSNGIIFSNYHGPNFPSGFVLGVNSANRIFVETYNEFGPAIYEPDITLGSKNAISVNKSPERIEFNYFDFNSKQTISEGFSVSPNSFFNSNDWYIGKAINPPSYFSGNAFNGYMDAFLYITGNMFPSQRNTLFSGFCVSEAPHLELALLEENCQYSYSNLTGEFSQITFDSIASLIYCVQTGYLYNNTGVFSASITGNVSGGSGHGVGYITGYTDIQSGYSNLITGFISGFSGVSNVASGLRVFLNNIPSGVDSYNAVFPAQFQDSPIVFTEILDNATILGHKISNVTNTGFRIDFSNLTNSTGYTLSSFAAPAQVNSDFKLFKTGIVDGSDSMIINFPNAMGAGTKLFCKFENNTNTIFGYNISDINPNNFKVTFSNIVNQTGDFLHILATNLSTEDQFQVISTPLTYGNYSQFIPFTNNFNAAPIVFGEITTSGTNILAHQISGVSASGFYANFSNFIPSGYTFNTMAWSGAQTRTGYIYSTGQETIYLGQITDECQNIYNLSGQHDILVATQYDLMLTRNVYSTGISGTLLTGYSGIRVPVYVPIDYTVSLNTGQNSRFIHNVTYQNDGFNSIQTNHSLYYSGANIQPDPFYVYKNCYQLFGYRLSNFNYDTNYIYSFGMDGVSYLNDIFSGDLSELYIFTGSHNKTNLDIDALFDRTRGEFFAYSPYQNSDINVYGNGIGLFPSGFTASGQFNEFINLQSDYTMSGNEIVSNGFFDGLDELIYDVIGGTKNIYNVPNRISLVSGVGYINNFNVGNNGAYLNGIKLVSGYDYDTVGSSFRFLDNYLTGVTGSIFTLPLDSNYTEYTGTYNYKNTPKFARNTSMLWANGLRQNLNEQYIEVANAGLLTGNKNFPTSNFNIYADDGNFWR